MFQQPVDKGAEVVRLRVASGILAMVLAGAVLASVARGRMFADYDGNVPTAVFTSSFSLLGLGLLASGIILLVERRERNPLLPIIVLGLPPPRLSPLSAPL